MTGPEHVDGDPWLPAEPDPSDPEWDDYDPYEWFPPGTSLDELMAWGWLRIRDLRPVGGLL